MKRKNKNSPLLKNARKLRQEMTKQERHLWYDFLRHYPVKIYKQRIIDSFIADFFCYSAKLVIEIDGGQHYTDDGISYDKKRTDVLNKYGFTVLRFSNLDIEKNFDGVCMMIDTVIKEKTKK